MGKDSIRRSEADYTYGYAEALRDGIVRPVLFLAYGGAMRWRTKAGDEMSARLGEPMTKDATAQSWRTALDANGEWIPSVLAAADKRLTEVRRGVPDAGGLVIASDQTKARAYAKILHAISGERPVVVLSDYAGSSGKIEEYAEGHQRWMVAVRMVSEGGGCAATVRRRLRHLDVHAVLLRPGCRAIRPRATSWRDGVDLPAERPVDPRARCPSRGGARPRSGPGLQAGRRALHVVGPRTTCSRPPT